MAPADIPARGSVRILTAEDAERFVSALAATMAELEAVLVAEADHIKAGRVRQGLEAEGQKAELAARYMRALEDAKTNTVALARFAPDALEGLRAAHAGFRAAVERSQMVIATARAVAESLVRGVADELARAAQPSVYAASRRMAEPTGQASPIVCSRRY